MDRFLGVLGDKVAGDDLSPATAENYSRDLAEFVDMAGPQTILDDITGPDVDRFVLNFRKTPDGRFKNSDHKDAKLRGVGSQVRFRNSLSGLFSHATRQCWVEANPMIWANVKPRMERTQNAARKALQPSAATALLEVPRKADSVPTAERARAPRADQVTTARDTFLIALMTEAGPRVSEVSNANRADIEILDDGTCWLTVMGKGRKVRRLPLSDLTMRLYREYLTQERPTARARVRTARDGQPYVVNPVEDAEQALVLTWRGTRMKPRDIQYMLQRRCAQLPAGASRVTPHGLRHTAATLLLASGAADIRMVKELLGHSSLAVTSVYLDTVSDELAAAVRAHPITGAQGSGNSLLAD